jgi:hypothetical protein
MASINPDWYAGNATRAYPLDDAATARDDAGKELPSQILVDCRIKFPSNLGQYAYVSGVTVSPNLVTVIMLATSNAVRMPGGIQPVSAPDQPLCAVSLPMPVVPYRHYPIQPMADGVGGWLVFGRGIDESYSGRFSTPGQTILLPRVASAYDPLPIPTLGKLGVDPPLTGVIQLLGATDLEVVQDTREIPINGTPVIVDAIIIRLVDSLNRNVFSLYTGPCGGRPESDSCNKPAVESINGVVPDCDGNLTINFQGVNVYDYLNGGGQALDLPLGMAEVCLGQDYLPDKDGNLPSDFPGDCQPGPQGPQAPPGGETPPIVLPPGCFPIPFCESFDEPTVPTTWVVPFGPFNLDADDSPVEPCGLTSPGGTPINQSYATTPTQLNASVWNCVYSVRPDSTSPLRCTVHLKLMPGTNVNGGIIWNYFLADPWETPPSMTFLWVGIDMSRNALGIGIFNGTTVVMSEWVTFPTGNVPKVGEWYELSVYALADPEFWAPPYNLYQQYITLSGVTDTAFQKMTPMFKFAMNSYGGLAGVGANNAHTRFSWFKLEYIDAPLGCVPLPYYDTFDGTIPTAWIAEFGTWVVENDDSPDELYGLSAPGSGVPPGVQAGFIETPPFHRGARTEATPATVPINRSYTAIDQSMRNVSIWDCGYDCRDGLFISTAFKMMPGSQINGGIVFNWLDNNPDFKRPTYMMATLDLTGNRIGIYYYYGATATMSEWVNLESNVPKAGEWYHMKVQLYPDAANGGAPFWLYHVIVTVTGVTDTAFKAVSTDFPQDLAYPGSKVGLGTTYGHTRFSWFRVASTDEPPPGTP